MSKQLKASNHLNLKASVLVRICNEIKINLIYIFGQKCKHRV